MMYVSIMQSALIRAMVLLCIIYDGVLFILFDHYYCIVCTIDLLKVTCEGYIRAQSSTTQCLYFVPHILYLQPTSAYYIIIIQVMLFRIIYIVRIYIYRIRNVYEQLHVCAVYYKSNILELRAREKQVIRKTGKSQTRCRDEQ